MSIFPVFVDTCPLHVDAIDSPAAASNLANSAYLVYTILMESFVPKEGNKINTRLSESVLSHIFYLRGHKVILDSDLASLYSVETKVLIQAVKRNPERFPDDFMFQLTKQELAILRSQSVTSSWGGRRTPPYAFTEQGVAMLSSVLRSKQAVLVNIEIMRAFVSLRLILAGNKELSQHLEALEKKYDSQFKVVFDAIRALMQPPETKKRPIGFRPWDEDE